MEWFYATSKDPIGPISEEEFQNLAKQGKITPKTLVWNSTMTDWKPYSDVFGGSAEQTAESAAAPVPVSEGTACSECGRTFPRDDMIRFGESWVCGGCKSVFVQKLKEGVNVAGAWEYGGFWIRFGAKIIDGIAIGVIQWCISFAIGIVVGVSSSPTPGGMTTFVIMSNIFNIGIAATYTTWFLGRFAATPGKMALGLKVIMADGDKVSYMRAFGRHFSEILSGILLCIGYLMAAFDDEKRTLHDRICDTRVVKNR